MNPRPSEPAPSASPTLRVEYLPPDDQDPAERRCEFYELEGQTHRIDGPAALYYENDVLVGVEYFVRDDLHRIDGPARVDYGEQGEVITAIYSLHGQELRTHTPEGFAEQLGKLTAAEKHDVVTDSPYAVFLEQESGAEKVIDALRGGVSTVEGMREVFAGAPVEWVRSYESGAGI